MSSIRSNRFSPFKDPHTAIVINPVDVESGFLQSSSNHEHKLRAKRVWARQAAIASSLFAILFLGVGVFFFRHITSWSVPQSLLFAISTVTSVGYGHMDTPRTALFQLFVALYILMGFALLAVAAAQFYHYFLDDDHNDNERSSRVQHYGKSSSKHSEMYSLWEETIKRTFRKTRQERSIGLPLLIGLFVLGTFRLGQVEQWSFQESLYFAVVSSTLVGYGDFIPKTTEGILMTCLWLPCSIVCMSVSMSTLATWYWQKNVNYESDMVSNDSMAGRTTLGRHVLPPFLWLAGALLIGQQEEWTFLESMYFAVVSSCTVGYGDFHPRTTVGMWMLIIWLPCSILSISVHMSFLAKLSIRLSTQPTETLDRFFRKRNVRIISSCGRAIVSVLPLLITLLTGALLIGHMEQWSFPESIYFALVSASTVGKTNKALYEPLLQTNRFQRLSFLFQDTAIIIQ